MGVIFQIPASTRPPCTAVRICVLPPACVAASYSRTSRPCVAGPACRRRRARSCCGAQRGARAMADGAAGGAAADEESARDRPGSRLTRQGRTDPRLHLRTRFRSTSFSYGDEEQWQGRLPPAVLWVLLAVVARWQRRRGRECPPASPPRMRRPSTLACARACCIAIYRSLLFSSLLFSLLSLARALPLAHCPCALRLWHSYWMRAGTRTAAAPRLPGRMLATRR